MLSKKVLELVMAQSNAAIIEWVFMVAGGFRVIDKKIDDYLIKEGYSGIDKRQKLKANVRDFIKADMEIMKWDL